MPVHQREVLARFQAGERALVYARRKTDGALFYLEDGTARHPELKEWVASELECFLPECPDRRLRLVNRHTSVRTARDGFSHHPGAGCNPTPESLFHQQGKAAVEAWVRTHRPGLRVETEVELGGGVRRPDVLITSADGRRLAIEVQYAALNVEELEERTRSYAALGVAVQWLFGHVGKQFKTHEGWGDVYVTFNDAHKAALKAGGSMLWLNPVANLLATPYINSRIPVASGVWRTPPTADAPGWVQAEVEPFDAGVTLHPEHGFLTRAQVQFEREQGWYEDARVRHAAVIAEREERERVRAQKAAELAARRREAKQRQAEEKAAEAARREADRLRDLETRRLEREMWMTPERRARLDAVLAENVRRTRPPRRFAAGPVPEQPVPDRNFSLSGDRPSAAASLSKRPCPSCGLPVDPVLRSGYHLGCEPVTARPSAASSEPPSQESLF